MIARPQNSDKRKPRFRRPFAFKLLGIFLIIATPVIGVIVIFKPVIAWHAREAESRYRLGDQFVKQDVLGMVSRMRRDTDFEFYFKMLNDSEVEQAAVHIYEILDRNRAREKWLEQIHEGQDRVKSLAVLLQHLLFPADYSERPQAYPELSMALRRFLYTDFQLAVMGASYKATHDANFRFEWDELSRKAAQQLQQILLSLPQEQRHALKAAFPVME